jgi:hypothetical protein
MNVWKEERFGWWRCFSLKKYPKSIKYICLLDQPQTQPEHKTRRRKRVGGFRALEKPIPSLKTP